jgi:hypothetical protein
MPLHRHIGSGSATMVERQPGRVEMQIALAAPLVIGTASTARAGGYVLPGSTDGVNPAYYPRRFPNYPGVNNAPSGDPNALPPSFDAAGHVYYPTAGNAYGFVPSATHHHKHRSAR